jgi:sugar phosphate isomerase/epimerase
MAEEKISIVTDEIAQDLDTVAKFMDEHNLHAIEVRTAGGERVPKIPDRIWEDFRMRVKNEGWRVIALSPGIFKGHYSDTERMQKELDEVLPETIGRAIEIRARHIIVFGFNGGPNEDPPPDVVGTLHRAAELCESSRLRVLIENEPGSFADTGERTRKLIDLVDHPFVAANWDPCNSNLFDAPAKLADSARSLSDYIKHVHVKDGCPVMGSLFARYGPIVTGHLGWRNHLKALKEIGFDGYFSVETHFEPLYESSEVLLGELRALLKDVNFWED